MTMNSTNLPIMTSVLVHIVGFQSLPSGLRLITPNSFLLLLCRYRWSLWHVSITAGQYGDTQALVLWRLFFCLLAWDGRQGWNQWFDGYPFGHIFASMEGWAPLLAPNWENRFFFSFWFVIEVVNWCMVGHLFVVRTVGTRKPKPVLICCCYYQGWQEKL